MITGNPVFDWNQRITPASTPADAPTKPLLNLSKEWFANRADLEGDHAVEAGAPTDATGEAGECPDCGYPSNCCGCSIEDNPALVPTPITDRSATSGDRMQYQTVVTAKTARHLERTIATLRDECEGLREERDEFSGQLERLAREVGAMGGAEQIVDAALAASRATEGQG